MIPKYIDNIAVSQERKLLQETICMPIAYLCYLTNIWYPTFNIQAANWLTKYPDHVCWLQCHFQVMHIHSFLTHTNKAQLYTTFNSKLYRVEAKVSKKKWVEYGNKRSLKYLKPILGLDTKLRGIQISAFFIYFR